MTPKGERCPRIEFAPTSVEGQALGAALQSPGCWLRAGMGGTVTGLDMAQLLARLPPGIDHPSIVMMAQAAEGPVIVATLERGRSDEGSV